MSCEENLDAMIHSESADLFSHFTLNPGGIPLALILMVTGGMLVYHYYCQLRSLTDSPAKRDASLKPSPNGKPRGPVCCALHSPQPEPGAFPLVPA